METILKTANHAHFVTNPMGNAAELKAVIYGVACIRWNPTKYTVEKKLGKTLL